MILTPELAQKIAYKTTSILGYNVNIMSDAGIIIGSGDKGRVKCFHEGAYEVIRTGKAMEISVEDSHRLEGAKPGVNLPIYFNDKIVGVVGITGPPYQVKQFGQLLTMLVEAMLHQHALAEQGRLEERAKESFILDILRYDKSFSQDLIIDRGKALGYDIFLPRIAMAISIEELEQQINSSTKNVTEKMEISIQRLKEDIIDSVEYMVENDKQNIVIFIKGNTLLLLKVINPDDIESHKAAKKMSKLAEKIQNILSLRRNLVATIGIGSYHEGISGLRKSYLQAIDAINVGMKLKGSGKIYQYDGLDLSVLLNSLAPEKKKQYIQYFEKEKRLADVLSDTMTETLECLFDNSFNISETARVLYVHRNTLLYRLDKIHNITGLNPLNFNDAIQLKVYTILKNLV